VFFFLDTCCHHHLVHDGGHLSFFLSFFFVQFSYSSSSVLLAITPSQQQQQPTLCSQRENSLQREAEKPVHIMTRKLQPREYRSRSCKRDGHCAKYKDSSLAALFVALNLGDKEKLLCSDY
jgi:hypothetical protein